MPQMSKQVLSQYIRTGCERQLALNLRPDNQAFAAERQALGMPYPQSPRPGLRQIQLEGEEWQAEKLHDLTQTFGPGAIVGSPYVTPANQTRYNPIPLQQALAQAQPVRFLVEAEFDVGAAFQQALGLVLLVAKFNLVYARVRPDIIAVLDPLTFKNAVAPDGTAHPLPPGDPRRQLRVIDIKMAAEASPGYFAEVVYYSIALAGWLIDQGLAQDFVVVPDGAVWPGSHEASHLLRAHRQSQQQGLVPNVQQLWGAMQKDLEPAPFEVFALRTRRFFQVELPRVLGTPWQALEWHVDNRCSFCEYLGENRGANAVPPVAPHPDHCLPTARAQDHLSQVAFISQGARLSLMQRQVTTVAALSQR
jgi:DNA replication ATP-dependent helicase Dna2